MDFNKNVKQNRTTHYGKTRIYSLKKIFDHGNLDPSKIPPYYKTLLVTYHHQYIEQMKKLNQKPLSFNSMKVKYGLPNNLDNYYNINPHHKDFLKPQRIQEKNALILILFYGMTLEHANSFLESLNLCRLDSPLASSFTKHVLYALRCLYSLEEANDFLFEHNIQTLY